MEWTRKIRNIHPCGAMALALILAVAGAVIVPAEASADEWLFGSYEHVGDIDGFSFQCSEELVSEPSTQLPPAALFMLDKSGSMRSGSNNLWNPAKSALDQAILTLEANMWLGLGLFSNLGSEWENGYRASLNHDFSLNAHNNIMGILDPMGDGSLGGGTPTGDGTYVSRGVMLAAPHLSAGGILITDGNPADSPWGYTDKEWVLHQSCQTRDAGVLQYVVGFGGNFDKEFNDIQAAALGTGSCTNGDPCADISNTNRGDCDGSYQVYTAEELRDLLLEIGSEIACTFPIDLTEWVDGMPDDPGSVRVKINDTNGDGWTDISHSSEGSSGTNGWYFASSSRENISLTSDLCSQLGENGIEEVSTQAACNCDAIIEENPYCLVSTALSEGCPAQRFECNGPTNIPECTGEAIPQQEDCPWEICPEPDAEPVLCHMDNDLTFSGSGNNFSIVPVEGSTGEPERETNRCEVGVIMCNQNEGAWCEPFSPMPELCDGLDNNCDGQIDNMSSGWQTLMDEDDDYEYDDSHISGMSIPEDAEYPGAACYEEDECACTDGQRGTHSGIQAVIDGESTDVEFIDYVNSWLPESEGGCSCIPNLSR